MIALPLTLDAAAWLLAITVCLHQGPRRVQHGPAAAASMLCALAGLFVAAGTGMPDWCNGIAVGGTVLAFYAIVCVLDPVPRPDRRDDDDGGTRVSPPGPAPMPGGDGGAGPDGPGPDPPWWPDFEREFRRYAAGRRPRRRVVAHRH